MKRTFRLSAVLLASVWLGGCSITPVRDKVSVNVPAHWSNALKAENAATTQDLARWWKDFNDPLLDDLVTRALAANHDLKIAAARVREARAFETVAESVLYPTIDATASAGRNKSFERLPKPPIGTTWTVGLEAGWEIDLFGGNRFDAKAASAQARALEEARHAVQVGLLAQVATNYLELRGAQKQTAILKENIAVQREQLRLLEARYRAGLATELDIARQQELLHTSEGALPLLANVTATLIHRLGVLLGEPPANLEALLGPPAPLPSALPKIPGLLPSDLFAQRPDIRRAQAEVVAAAAKLGSAKTDLFPKFFLSASGGRSALDLSPLPLATGNVFALGLGLVEPLFNAGRIRANIEAVDARLSQVAASYEKTYLTALEDVEDAFVAHTTARGRRDELTQAAEAAARAEHLAQEFYKRGVTDFLAVLDSERRKLTAEDDRVKAETAVSVSMVSLYRAFGGGWVTEDETIVKTQ
ncbi:MAG TPA: TolC family protein [Burkholderiales bacterium]|nr:TolC family protein [Burkholderiales bacterium]